MIRKTDIILIFLFRLLLTPLTAQPSDSLNSQTDGNFLSEEYFPVNDKIELVYQCNLGETISKTTVDKNHYTISLESEYPVHFSLWLRCVQIEPIKDHPWLLMSTRLRESQLPKCLRLSWVLL